VRQARFKVCVADHTKLGVVSAALICRAAEIDLLITDGGASDEQVAPFLSLSMEVRRV
jgi:DeoR family transcriptional regulator of aga operon